MSYIKVYVHFVWSTKNRTPFLINEIKESVLNHIKEYAKSKGIFIDFINGYHDHIHCLISLNDDISIGKIANLLKGESSHWINANKLTKEKFAWQDEYLAIGIGDDKINIVRDYIANQENHHKKITYSQEYLKFIERYGLEIKKNNFG